MPEPKQAPEPAPPQPVIVPNPQTIISAIQQRQTAAAQLQTAEAIVQNAVLSAALELGIDPKVYALNVHQNEQGQWEFRAK